MMHILHSLISAIVATMEDTEVTSTVFFIYLCVFSNLGEVYILQLKTYT